MSIKSATPYLLLNGRAREAIALYAQALGAKVANLQRFGDVQDSCPEAQKDFVMHAELRLDQAVLLLSDGPGPAEPPGPGAVSVALDLDDVEASRRSFDALARSGKVVQPLIDAHWGALFGVVQDAFGVHWMFSVRKQ
jgi:PhnB protein